MNDRFILYLLIACFSLIACSKENDVTKDPDTNATPYFSWDTTIALEQSNGWCFTLFPEHITLTNIIEGKQYMINWQGGFATGEKKQGSLKTIVRGSQTRTTDLDVLDMKVLGNGYYRMTFRGGGRKGEMVFVK